MRLGHFTFTQEISMKIKAILFSLLISTAAFAGPYELISVPHEDIDSHLTIGTDANNTPKNLQGLWWMNGNPLADEVVSFAGAQWREVVEGGEVVGHEGTLPVFDEGVWSWHDSTAGRLLYSLVLANRLVYVATFNKDFTKGVVVPRINPIGPLPQVTLPPSLLVTFTRPRLTRTNSVATALCSAHRTTIVSAASSMLMVTVCLPMMNIWKRSRCRMRCCLFANITRAKRCRPPARAKVFSAASGVVASVAARTKVLKRTRYLGMVAAFSTDGASHHVDRYTTPGTRRRAL
jgi:hypothetical protein